MWCLCCVSMLQLWALFLIFGRKSQRKIKHLRLSEINDLRELQHGVVEQVLSNLGLAWSGLTVKFHSLFPRPSAVWPAAVMLSTHYYNALQLPLWNYFLWRGQSSGSSYVLVLFSEGILLSVETDRHSPLTL